MRTAFGVILFFFSIVFMLQVYQQGTLGGYTAVNISGNISAPGFTNAQIIGGSSLGTVSPNGANSCPQQLGPSGSPVVLPPAQCVNNGLFTWAGSLLFIAIVAAGIFIALGIFAGGFGFGLHAPTMISVSVMLSLVIYINLFILSQFTSIPIMIWLIINGFFTVLLVIGIMDTLQPTKVGG